MEYTDPRTHLHVTFHPKECPLSRELLARMEQRLGPLGEVVQDFPQSDLNVHIVYHPRSQSYHVETRLRLPGQSLFCGDQDRDPYTAFDRCVHHLILRAARYRENPDERSVQVAQRMEALNNSVVAANDEHSGALGQAVDEGNYSAFRRAAVGYEDWLRTRIGRWVQRYPEVEKRIGDDIAIGDLVEEVYLNAFECYPRRSLREPFHEWLASLIAPSLNAMLRHPDEESENASFVRSLRAAPVARR
jgi:ribosome-associated translation inhibitor RaiA